MRVCDIQKTSELARLCTIEKSKRDAKWQRDFYQTVPTASMSNPEERAMVGPDGFPYLILNIPEPDEPFEAFSVVSVLPHLLESGLGIVINANKEEPDWVFPYGTLWSFLEFDSFEAFAGENEAVPDNPLKRETLAAARQVFTGQPAESLLPQYARKVIKSFMTDRLKISCPQVFLLVDPQSDYDQSLVFSVFPENYRSEAEFSAVLSLLRWYIPPHFGLTAVSKDSNLARAFQPL